MPTELLITLGSFMTGAVAGSILTYIRQRTRVAEVRKDLEQRIVPPSDCEARYGMKALIFANDAKTINLFSDLLREVHVGAQQCGLEADAANYLACEKVDSVVIDVDNLSNLVPNVKNSRERGPNKDIVVFAIASETRAKRAACDLGTSFMIERPLEAAQIRKLIRTAYGRMLRGRKSYFRLAIELPITLRRHSGEVLRCTTINLSQSGVAVNTPSSLEAGERLDLLFAIPNTNLTVSAHGTVIWDDRHGKAAFTFESTNPAVQAQLATWLEDHFYMRFHPGRDVAEVSADTPQ